jgi:two-component system chemotaxis response regulator CheB
MKPIRVLVVEDSLTIRKHLVEVISKAGLEVVGEAADGKAAIELCERFRPDVITMDMMLPLMTGLSATEYIMAYCPTPILIVSASTNRGEVFKTYDALAAGAVDVLEKPAGTEPDEGWERQLITALRVVSRVRVITHPRARLGRLGQARLTEIVPSGKDRSLIAIGASTGGPGAVLTILKILPPGFPLPILVVIHISEPFGYAMTEWLGAQTGMDVRCAVDEEPLPRPGSGRVIVAPPGRHLEVAGKRLRTTDGPERHFCRPSVDVLFESIARHIGSQTAACLLTGMGRDGAEGMLAIKRNGGLTIAQDEESSVVFGMPGEAARIGAADYVLPLGDIGDFLGRLAVSPEAAKRSDG